MYGLLVEQNSKVIAELVETKGKDGSVLDALKSFWFKLVDV